VIVLAHRFFFRKGFLAIALWPFIFIKHKHLKEDAVFINHERIHLRQQIELLVVFFYVWYVLEFFFRWLQYKHRYKAYRNISFEREAYANEANLQYLENRSLWCFIHFFFEKPLP
jgi:hypothetical protein